MAKSTALLQPEPSSPAVVETPQPPVSYRPFFLGAGILLAVFALPLAQLARFSLHSDLYSHIVLIPLVSGYFVWLKRRQLPHPAKADTKVAVIAAFIGACFGVGYIVALLKGGAPAEDQHALAAGAFVSATIAVVAATLGRPILKAVAFPLGFLVFMSPIPTAVIPLIELFLQHGSAAVAYALFKLIGTPVYNDQLLFILPGFSMQVAPQCSGIHSSLALFITSVAAGYLFLESPRHRAVLALAVIPLALLRNGFRVFVIGELCVRISPDMINSWVHKQGGPFFFALSLIPFSVLLYALFRLDRRAARTKQA